MGSGQKGDLEDKSKLDHRTLKGIWTLLLGNWKMINIYGREEYEQISVLERPPSQICEDLSEWKLKFEKL